MKSQYFSQNRVLSNVTENANSFKRIPRLVPRKKYNGTILFVYGEYEDVATVRSNFDKLPEFVEFYGHQMAFLTDVIKQDKNLRNGV
jgi:hypothetical protein